jgi:hypothetical protein
MDKIEYSRMLVKRTDQTGEVPTIPPITAVTLNQFIPTDLFIGEFFLNEVDDLMWVRTANGILPISLSGSTGTTVPNLTQVLFQGNATNGYNIDVSAGDTIVFNGLTTGSTTQFLGIDVSGNTIVSGVMPGTPDLQSVLFQGNTTNGNDIEVSSGDTIVFNGLITGSTTDLLGLDASGNTIVTSVPSTDGLYLPLSGGTVTGNTYFGATSGITMDQVNNRLGINTANPQYTIEAFGTKSNVTYQDTAGGVLQISGDTFLPRFNAAGAPSLTKPIFSLSMGVRTYDDITYPGYGKVGDGFIYASNEMNGLNIINRQGTGTTEDYIRFYAGQDANGTTPDIHIQGSGATRGYVGVGTITPTQPLDVAGNTRVGGNLILRTIGSGTSVINLGLDSSGVVVTGTTGGSSPFETSTGLNSVRSTYYTTNAPNPYDMLIGGSGNTITNSTKFNHIIGGKDNTISANRTDGLNTIVGSYDCLIGPSLCGLASGIFSSYDSTINNSGYGSVILGGWKNSLDDFNVWGSAIVGGESNTKTSGRAGFMGGGRNNSCGGGQSVILGGNNNSISSGQINNSIMGGNNNTISSNAQLSSILGGDSNTITSTAARGSILTSTSSTINGSSDRSTIIASTGSTISGKTQAVMIGTLNRTANDNNTTYTENQRSFGQIYNGYYDNGPGSSFTIDWNRGNSQKITMTGNTSFTFTNNKDGAQYRLQVVNAGTHDITGATASGYSILCEGGAIPNITNNGVDLCVFEVMGEDILVRHFANFATP